MPRCGATAMGSSPMSASFARAPSDRTFSTSSALRTAQDDDSAVRDELDILGMYIHASRVQTVEDGPLFRKASLPMAFLGVDVPEPDVGTSGRVDGSHDRR